jgi:hypothetical protein
MPRPDAARLCTSPRRLARHRPRMLLPALVAAYGRLPPLVWATGLALAAAATWGIAALVARRRSDAWLATAGFGLAAAAVAWAAPAEIPVYARSCGPLCGDAATWHAGALGLAAFAGHTVLTVAHRQGAARRRDRARVRGGPGVPPQRADVLGGLRTAGSGGAPRRPPGPALGHDTLRRPESSPARRVKPWARCCSRACPVGARESRQCWQIRLPASVPGKLDSTPLVAKKAHTQRLAIPPTGSGASRSDGEMTSSSTRAPRRLRTGSTSGAPEVYLSLPGRKLTTGLLA